MRTWADVAVITKLRNRQERFVVKATAGLPFLLEPGDEVRLVPPKTDVARRVSIGEVVPIDECSAVVELVGIEGDDEARQVVGMHCLMRRSAIGEEAFAEPTGLWETWDVVDKTRGHVGRICGVVDNPAQSLLEVEGENGTFLVPAVDEIVLDVDVDQRVVHVDLPKGLLELGSA